MHLQPVLPVGPVRAPSPCCWDGRCIHCRERAAERSETRQRSLLTDADREALEIYPRPSRSFAARLRRQMIPTAPATKKLRPVRSLGTAVLPADFVL